jgi:hypothetical protein
MSNTVERLEELLTLKDEQLSAAQDEISDLQRQLEYTVDWMLHERPDAASDTLPVPRLELRVMENWEYGTETQVSMVIAERGGNLSRVPLGYSKRSGHGMQIDAHPTEGELPAHFVSDLPSIFHDMCFYSENTKLRAFVTLDEDHCYEVVNLRPLKLLAVN